MRFQIFINEDVVQKALSIEEPKIAKFYTEEEVTEWIKILQQAAEQLTKEISSMEDDDIKKARQAKLRDILDKRARWEEKLQGPEETEADPEAEAEVDQEDQQQ